MPGDLQFVQKDDDSLSSLLDSEEDPDGEINADGQVKFCTISCGVEKAETESSEN